MGVWAYIIGIGLILCSGWQAYRTFVSLRQLQTSGGKDTPPFMLGALWTNVVVAVFLLIAGIGTMSFH